MKIKVLLILLLSVGVLSAQKRIIENVQSYHGSGLGPIMEGKDLAGYYMFYSGKSGKIGTKKFTLEIFDKNLNTSKKVEMIKATEYVLLDICFNKTGFICLYLNNDDVGLRTGRQLEIYTYDLNLTQIATKTYVLDDMGVMMYFSPAMRSAFFPEYLNPMGENKFLLCLPDYEKNSGLNITCLDYSLKDVWKIQLKEKEYQMQKILAIKNGKAYFLLTGIKNLKNIINPLYAFQYLTFTIDLASGAIVNKAEIKDDKYNIAISKTKVNQDGSLSVVGEYCDKKNMKSIGLFIEERNASGVSVKKTYADASDPKLSELLADNQKPENQFIGVACNYISASNEYYFLRYIQDSDISDLVLYVFDKEFKLLQKEEIKRTGEVDISGVPAKAINKSWVESIKGGTVLSQDKDDLGQELLLIYDHSGVLKAKEYKYTARSFGSTRSVNETMTITETGQFSKIYEIGYGSFFTVNFDAKEEKLELLVHKFKLQ